MMFGRRIFIDIYISMFMAGTLLFFALAERYPGTAAAVPAADVCVGRSGRADEGPCGGGASGAGVRALPRRARRAEARARDDDPDRHRWSSWPSSCPWYAALYHRYGWTYITSFFLGENVARYTEGVGVETRRGPLSTCRSCSAIRFRGRSACSARRACGSPIARAHGRCPADDSEAVARAARAHADVAVGSRDRRVLLVLRGEAGSLHLSHRPRGGGARRAADRAIDGRRYAGAAALAPGHRRRYRRAAGDGRGRDAVHLPVGRDGLCARRREAGRVAAAAGGVVALALALAERARAPSWRSCCARHVELGVRVARPPQLRALQAGAAVERRDSASGCATATRSCTTTSPSRAWCSTFGGTSTSSSSATCF